MLGHDLCTCTDAPERSDGSTARSAALSSPSLTLLKGLLPLSLFGSSASVLGTHGGAVQIEAYRAMNETVEDGIGHAGIL